MEAVVVSAFLGLLCCRFRILSFVSSDIILDFWVSLILHAVAVLVTDTNRSKHNGRGCQG